MRFPPSCCFGGSLGEPHAHLGYSQALETPVRWSHGSPQEGVTVEVPSFWLKGVWARQAERVRGM